MSPYLLIQTFLAIFTASSNNKLLSSLLINLCDSYKEIKAHPFLSMYAVYVVHLHT